MSRVVKRFSKIKLAFISSLILVFALAVAFFQSNSAKAELKSKSLKHFTLPQENAVPVEIERSGSPWIKLKQGVPINSEFVGTDSAINQFENVSLSPRSLASADFNFDGFVDVLSGFASPNGGIITLHKGNKEAFSPEDPQVLAGIRNGEFPVSFEKMTTVIETPIAPDFIVTGKFIGGSPLDLVIGSRTSNSIFVFSSNRNGGFNSPKEIRLDDVITALAADRFDVSKAFTGLSVATKTNGGELLVFNGNRSLDSTKPQKVSLGKEASSLIIASPDGATAERDLFILADGEMLRIPQIGKNAQNLSRIDLPYRVNDFAIGEFIRDRRSKAEIAVLAENGNIYYLQNGSLDLRPFTESEMREHFAKNGRGRDMISDSTDRESSLADNWTISEEHNLGIYEANRQNSAPLLQKSYITGNSTEDLLVVNPTSGKVQVIFKEPNYEPNALSFSGDTKIENVGFSRSPIAAMPVRLNVMGQQGIVVLENAKLEPTPIMLAPNATFTVTKTADTADGACNADCSLREAKVAANGAAGADMITFSLNGTHQLTIAGANENTASTGDLDITQPLTITGNGTANTILQSGTNTTNGIDKIISINPTFTSAFATSMSGLTMQFGRNPSPFGGDGFGGAFDWEGTGTGTLTVSNVTISNNRTVDGDGGGVAITNSSAGNGNTSFTGVTFSGNVPGRAGAASPFGGAIFAGNATHFALNNVSMTGNNVNGSGGGGLGGGIFSFAGTGAFGIATIANSTISTNAAPLNGGGINTSQPISFTTPITFNGNTSGSQGGAMYHSVSGTTTISEASFIGNSATTGGGGIYNNAGTLNLNFSEFTGNTGGGSTGLQSAGGTVSAENNWWGCNTGPSAAPCNTASATGGTLDFNPWLQLRISSALTTVVTGQTTTLTASFLQNSDGTAIAASNLDVLVGQSVTWGGSGATITSPQNTIQASGTATSTFSAASIGAKTGTATVDSATATVNITVNKANTSPVINTANIVALAPSVTGQSIVVTYSVPATAPGGGTPTGNVTVTDGTSNCVGTVAAGQCNLTITTAGTKTLTATYAGDANYNGATSPGFTQVVNKANTSATITGQSNTSTPQGQSFFVNYSVTVDAPGSGTPTGTVTVSDGVESCTATVAAGVCQINLTTLGPRTLTATYNGDANFNTDASPGVGHTVLPITSAPASISGRVLTAGNQGIARAKVSVVAQNGEVYSATTNSFGYFRIEGLATGSTYILNVVHRGYQFDPQTISLNEDVIDLSIVGLE